MTQVASRAKRLAMGFVFLPTTRPWHGSLGGSRS